MLKKQNNLPNLYHQVYHHKYQKYPQKYQIIIRQEFQAKIVYKYSNLKITLLS